MSIEKKLKIEIVNFVNTTYQVTLEQVEFQPTRKEFNGDLTVVIFPMLRHIKGNPVEIGKSLGKHLSEKIDEITAFNVIKGFLNLELSDSYFLNFFTSVKDFSTYGKVPEGKDAVMVEYSSPNTNKPLHLGHIRNILLGYATAEILKASGKKVYKTQIINDRGIHISKSMLAWQKFGNGATPESTGLKGDKLVGDYYVLFNKTYSEEINTLQKQGKSLEEAKEQAPILLEAQEMLRKWEAGNPEVLALWEKMNDWVYKGFNKTYKDLEVNFEKLYYESDTYLLGKEVIEMGLKNGVFYKREDNSVWCDLKDEGLDEKLVLRGDGTAVYITQDVGTAIQRTKDFPDVNGMIYTVGNEQDYHFKVLFVILKKLGYHWAENLYHLSYGLVDLPSGRMKSREGTVVDADDLIAQMAETAKTISEEHNRIDIISEEEKKELYHTIGMGALKYYILKVDPKKKILFNPEESVDFQGNTGPFIQYAYARIQAILRKAKEESIEEENINYLVLNKKEKALLKQLQLYPETIKLAAQNYSPALIANFTYELVREFNSFYQNVSIFGADSSLEKSFRIQLCDAVGEVIKSSFGLLGISVPNRM